MKTCGLSKKRFYASHKAFETAWYWGMPIIDILEQDLFSKNSLFNGHFTKKKTEELSC